MRVDLGDVPDGVSEPLSLGLPRSIVARMVVGEYEDLVAGPQVESARDPVVRLARVAGDEDLVRADAQVRRQELPGSLLPPPDLAAVAGDGLPVQALGELPHGIEDEGRGGAEVRRVHDRELSRHHELFPHALPVYGPPAYLLRPKRPRPQSFSR